MNGHDLFLEMRDLETKLGVCLGEFGKYGREFAQTEHDYRVEFSQELLKGRAEGLPTTILDGICRGKRNVAEKRLKRDIAEAMYKSAAEHIQGLKLRMRVLEAQIEREWKG